ncbi:UNVERIFIED_CONTAM: hypothetical protein FKN15_015344 [Acipenser sinensis]
MSNYYLYPQLTARNPSADSGNGGWNTGPPKRAPAKPSFFALQSHSNATRPIVPEDNTDLAAPLQNHRKIKTVYDEKFKTRLQLVNNTDSLKIKNLQEADSGFYQVEDFSTNRFLKKFQLTVYNPVPKPHVKKMDGSVELGNRTCTLLCSVGNPSGVTVSWMRHGKSLNTTQLKLTQGCNVTYTCVASNPASNQTVTVKPSDYCLDKGNQGYGTGPPRLPVSWDST